MPFRRRYRKRRFGRRRRHGRRRRYSGTRVLKTLVTTPFVVESAGTFLSGFDVQSHVLTANLSASIVAGTFPTASSLSVVNATGSATGAGSRCVTPWAFFVDPNDFPSLSSYTQLFDEYSVRSATLYVTVPGTAALTTDTTATVNAGYVSPIVAWTYDYDDSTLADSTSNADILAYKQYIDRKPDTRRRKIVGKGAVRIKLRNPAATESESSLIAVRRKPQWFNSQDVTGQLRGIKGYFEWVIPRDIDNAESFNVVFDVHVRYHFWFRGFRPQPVEE